MGSSLGSLVPEIDGGEGGKREGEGKRLIHVRDRISPESAKIPDIGAAVDGSVGIQDLGIEAGLRDSDEVAFADDGRRVYNDDEKIVRIFSAAKE